jgi:hypothetical protein
LLSMAHIMVEKIATCIRWKQLNINYLQSNA